MIQRACAWGGEGTPEVSEYCAAELGALQGTGMAAARVLIADALDLRYRLPRLWDRVLTGGVRAWQARKIAEQTRSLSWEACADVDHALSDFVGMMPWPRFVKILSATILEADPAQGAERAERARTTQDVFSFDSEDGLKTIVAKAAAGDAIWFLATVNRIAEILTARGDTDPIGARRARAIGILAQPAEALRLLSEHQHHPTDDHLVTFRVVVPRSPAVRRRTRQPVDTLECSAWTSRVRRTAVRLEKGDQVTVSGELRRTFRRGRAGVRSWVTIDVDRIERTAAD